MDRQVQQASDIIWRRIGDEIVIIGDNGLYTHVLNKTGAFIWERCDGRQSAGEIAGQVCENFEVSFEAALADVVEYIDRLVGLEILTPVAEKAI